MMIKHWLLALLPLLMVSLTGCKINWQKADQQLNLFSLQDEVTFGLQVQQEINSNRQEFPVLPEQGNEEVYKYIRGLRDKLLNTGTVKYRNEFAWEVKIIDDDQTLNAFATPGGYIYIYTGLILFLDSEDQLLGVLGHEMAHAALRHSTRQLTKLYGAQMLSQVVTGKSEPGMLEQIAMSLVSLKFSRSHEAEADQYSVVYLCGTPYNAAGAAGFFQKMENQPTVPQFLSTHPNPGNRVKDIQSEKQRLGCKGTKTNASEYAKIKLLLQ